MKMLSNWGKKTQLRVITSVTSSIWNFGKGIHHFLLNPIKVHLCHVLSHI